MVILSFCWVISCIPVFTIGAASTALYDTSRRVIHRDEGYVWRGYWHAFKVNFKQATKAWLVQLIILIVLLGDIYITWSGLKTGNQWGTFSIVFIIMALIAAAWAIYTSAYISRFEQVTKITLKNTILIQPAVDITGHSDTCSITYTCMDSYSANFHTSCRRSTHL